MSRMVVELAGPAGAGKTTLAAMLAQGQDATLGVNVNRAHLASAIATESRFLLDARRAAGGRWWTRGELRDIAYLRAWRTALTRSRETGQGGLVLLDHGPVYRLASLSAYGPPMVRSSRFQRWWAETAHAWSNQLDAVIWLDTADEELRRRIDARDRAHQLRGAGAPEAQEFLSRYRAGYERVLAVVTSVGTPVVRFDTSSLRPEEIAHSVRGVLDVPAPGVNPS